VLASAHHGTRARLVTRESLIFGTLAALSAAAVTISGMLVISGAVVLGSLVRTPLAGIASPIACAMILAGSVMASHSVARVDHRGVLVPLTLAHHLASAAWIGGLLYLLLALRHSQDTRTANTIVSRFSRVAMASVAVPVLVFLTFTEANCTGLFLASTTVPDTLI